MAWLNKKQCHVCQAETQHNGNECLVCQERQRLEAEAVWMAQSLDEKLLNLHRRLLRAERGPARY